MTQQVRTSYRRHRKATWIVAIALVALAAAILIPIASGAADKTYTLSAIPATTSNPTATPIDPAALCTGDGGTVTLYLTNTAKSASLGSTLVSIPTYVTAVTASVSTTGKAADEKSTAFTDQSGSAWVSGDPVLVQNMSLPKWGYLKLVLTVPKTAVTAQVGAVVKQSNNFNDTSGTANLFSDPPFPTITVSSCTVTISGTLYFDTNGDGSVTGDSPITTKHIVTLTGDASGTIDTSTSNPVGSYTFTVPKNGSYKVCVTSSPTGEVQTMPTESDPSKNVCTSTVDGYAYSGITVNQTANFAFAGGLTASCGSTLSSSVVSQDTSATVKAKITTYDSSCKADNQQYVFTTYSDTTSRTAKLAPVVSASSGCKDNLSTGKGCEIVAEVITWSLTGAAPDTKTLSYDDTAQGGYSGPMQFCQKDPFNRTAADGVTLYSGTGYMPADILPANQSTCLARTTQGKFYDSSTKTWVTQRIDEVYSAFDGKINLT